MARQIAIVHGWSDTSESFEPLVQFLEGNGFEAVPLWLGDYISLDDDVKVEDVAKRMQQVVTEKKADGLSDSFDLIVHSTGGLVARQWLAMFYADGKGCPVKRLLMLAPANYGSRLASMGQSMLGRLVKGWKNWFHTGKEMLTALELGSRFQWDLAQRDLFVPKGQESAPSPYGPEGVWPFVIVGTHPYTSELRKIVNENGSDGTVRVPAANLNARGVTIDFSHDELNPKVSLWQPRHGTLQFPLAVLPDRTHASIITPDENEVNSAPASGKLLGELILEALACLDMSKYSAIQQRWATLTEETASLASDIDKRAAVFPRRPILDVFKSDVEPAFFHQYLQAVVRVVDDHGVDVPDYFLEFFGPDSKTDHEAVYFHSQVVEDVHPNGSARCFYVDRTDLVTNYYNLIPEGKKREVAMSISATAPGDNISYFRNSRVGAAGHLVVHQESNPEQRWLQRNATHFVEIIIPRTPKDSVFKLTKVPPGSR